MLVSMLGDPMQHLVMDPKHSQHSGKSLSHHHLSPSFLPISIMSSFDRDLALFKSSLHGNLPGIQTQNLIYGEKTLKMKAMIVKLMKMKMPMMKMPYKITLMKNLKRALKMKVVKTFNSLIARRQSLYHFLLRKSNFPSPNENSNIQIEMKL
jgi:hypothetical protein